MYNKGCKDRKEFDMNKEELVKAVSEKAKMSQKQATEVIAATLETIQKQLLKERKLL